MTDIELANATLFDFDDVNSTSDATVSKRSSGFCKVFPEDKAWPSKITWAILDLLLGGRLITTIPLAASCYNSWPAVTSTTECEYVTDEWTNSTLHYNDPTSVMWPLYQGRTCMPTDDPNDSCTLGGYPNYAINVSSVAQIQLAVNFARNTNIRLVVKNTGHDFNGKSAGAGALSIWTHNLKDITYYANYRSSGYSGAAIKMGAGVQAQEIYAAAKSYGVTVVGGEGRTVGVAGGYIAGGGHSPLSSLYGMAADQVLAFEVVTADGRFVTASDTQNTDLFWALRGGGGGTFGVITSVLVKAYPKMQVTVATWSFSTSTIQNSTIFWQAVEEYMKVLPTYTDAGTYAYFDIFPLGNDQYTFLMAPFFAPTLTIAQTQNLLTPLISKWAALGFNIAPTYTNYDNFHDAWWAGFALEAVGSTTIKTASRLFPKSNWQSTTALNATFEAVKYAVEQGGVLLAFQIAATKLTSNTVNSVNPAWRQTCMHAILGISWDANATDATIAARSNILTNDWMAKWRNASPDAGAYMSEADISEPNFQKAFYGSNYDRLYSIKQAVDPKGLFYAPTGVGSENWVIQDQIAGIPTQNGRLCTA